MAMSGSPCRRWPKIRSTSTSPGSSPTSSRNCLTVLDGTLHRVRSNSHLFLQRSNYRGSPLGAIYPHALGSEETEDAVYLVRTLLAGPSSPVMSARTPCP